MPAPTVLELLWGASARPKRGPKPSLSVAGIVAEAMALADAEGLAGLSMQRLADRLGNTKMSLYRYVPGKAELTALMLEAAIGVPPELESEPPAAEKTGPLAAEPWRAGLHAWAAATFERYRKHPWVLELLVGVRPLGPNEMGWMEAALRVLADTPLTGPERLDTIVVLNGHVRSLAQQTMGSDTTEEGFTQGMAAAMELAGDRFPQLTAALTAPEQFAAQRDDALDFGIERILDGVGALMAQRGESS
ncbi:TetR/AcrR family transcriptional regulator [Nocardia donostiensis]|uniref:TetR family transcriptional regulator n=1 Tax=Nocardia donostiensis TaxID=1538463 RepID=A0A1W0BE37_9NOCA|nr:TetR/AcrR family transcriptional regulator C-terminal domain-containing protein [Nocardia donostiensis]ONM50596.1 TetR family transcriptional regulator [Nocardia donostiensis]OQS20760.1 TetR family transcriptional regulator [Nocardia donostiensis]